ncbi:VWA domain-containing protein [bacterium]|nr:VWA domain-containing protein [bacterium]
MGLEHRDVRPQRRQRSHLGKGAAAVALLGAVVSAFVLLQGRQPGVAQAAPDAPRASAPREKELAAPAPREASSHATIKGGALSAEATLGHAKLLRGSEGELLLHVGVDATEEDGEREHRPIDFALVLDVSGSMEDQNKIGLLKLASKGLLEKLRASDRVAVVVFSNDARTVFPLAALEGDTRRKDYARTIDALEAGGGTNISSGLLAGADELRKAEPRAGSARRIVLMTDGLANFGVQDPRELVKLVNGLAHEGITISTVGLGLEYGEKLLADMADAGGGSFHDADKAERLARIYEVEVEATRALVARDARIVISPEPGVSVESVFLWPASLGKDGERSVSLGDLSAGRHVKAVARLRVPTGADLSSVAVARVSLRYEDVRGKKAERVVTEALPLAVGIVQDAEVARASAPATIKKELDEVAIADGIRRAREAALAGKVDETRALLAVVHERLGSDTLAYRAADGTESCVSLLEIAAVATRIAARGESVTALDDADNALLKRCQGAAALGR